MVEYSVGEVANMIGLSSTTIRNYSEQDELQPFLSNLATRTGSHRGAKERRYLMEDVIVLNTVRIRKTHLATWEDVVADLTAGIRENDLPLSSTLTMTESKAETFQINTRLTERLAIAEQQVVELERQLEDERKEHRDNVERLLKEKNAEIAELYREVGKLQARLEINDIDPETGKKRNDEI